MAEASPIGRGKNITLETVLTFIDAIPKRSMEKSDFLNYGESQMKGWRQTHSQIARQIALYYEDENGFCHPRFTSDITIEVVSKYMENWACKYYVPNPFTPSLKDYKGQEVSIYAAITERIQHGNNSFSAICNSIFGIELNNLDKVRVYLSNFTNLVISDDVVRLNESIDLLSVCEVHPQIIDYSEKAYFDYFTQQEEADNDLSPSKSPLEAPLQQIFFGAPGTGKSHTIKQECKKYPHYRITFHPDTDYAAFVGSYKPITIEEPVYTNIGTTAHPVVDTTTGNQLTQKKITYNYVTQPFLKAYIEAWKEQQNENPQPVFLVIEEINRGNCAQIFGDIFQLLDRNESGFSDYPITTDSDLEKVLANSFANLEVFNAEYINGVYDDDIVSKIKDGTHLLLPNNLYIWATMNTSDQSLFPIDSAFKRRWDWKYIKISDSGMNYCIAVNGNEYDWWEFVQAINRKIEEEGSQEDKKLGYFFAKTTQSADGRYIINADKFLSKVLFFLYNDVYKDFGYEDDIFKGEDGTPMQFADYFDHLGNTVEPAVERFLQNLGLNPINGDIDDESIDMDGDAPVNSRISVKINGRKARTITKALYRILSSVVESYTYDDLYQSVMNTLSREEAVMTPISSVDDYQKENRWYKKPLTTKDGISFVITNQWKKGLLPQIESLASALGVSYENLSE